MMKNQNIGSKGKKMFRNYKENHDKSDKIYYEPLRGWLSRKLK